VLGCVDSKDHALLTMTALLAREPKRFRVPHSEAEFGKTALERSVDGLAVEETSLSNAKPIKRALVGTHKPESIPLYLGVQGASKLVWVAVWFLARNSNKIVSPGAAVYGKRVSCER
jgi:hypothetical protein